ncbi:hypothetical protein D3C78_1783360 [compost metagenome]
MAWAYRAWAGSDTRKSSSLTALALLGAWAATAAPLTFTCVPPLLALAKVGRITLMASPHLRASVPSLALFIWPT